VPQAIDIAQVAPRRARTACRRGRPRRAPDAPGGVDPHVASEVRVAARTPRRQPEALAVAAEVDPEPEAPACRTAQLTETARLRGVDPA
jgi:hypothetical protein